MHSGSGVSISTVWCVSVYSSVTSLLSRRYTRCCTVTTCRRHNLASSCCGCRNASRCRLCLFVSATFSGSLCITHTISAYKCYNRGPLLYPEHPVTVHYCTSVRKQVVFMYVLFSFFIDSITCVVCQLNENWHKCWVFFLKNKLFVSFLSWTLVEQTISDTDALILQTIIKRFSLIRRLCSIRRQQFYVHYAAYVDNSLRCLRCFLL